MNGDKACPFNALYRDFLVLVRHEDKFLSNQRMLYVFSTWGKFPVEKQKAIHAQTILTLKHMVEGTL